MIKNFVIASVVSAALIGTSWAFWQEPAPSRPNPSPRVGSRLSGSAPTNFFSNPTITFLRIREVQTELKLEEDRAKKVEEINAEVTRERAQIVGEYTAKLTEVNKKAEDQTLGLLNEAQRRRTEQLRLQQQGPRAFSANSVAEKLGLSQEQRDEIAKRNQQVFGDASDRSRTTTAPNPTVPTQDRLQQALEEGSKRSAETREKILALLTPEQKAKWSEMTGESFKFPTPQWSTTGGTSTRSSEPAKPSVEKKDQ